MTQFPHPRRRHGVFLLIAGGLFAGLTAHLPAGESDAWIQPGKDERLVLENSAAKVVVWPYAGGAITEYLNKKTGTNYVAGEVKPGVSGFGWTDCSRQNNPDPPSQWFSSLPNEARRFETPTEIGIELRCQAGGLELSRRIALDRSSPRLRVTVQMKNLSDVPRRLWPRWHPYMMIGDPYAENSAVFLPDAGGNLRKIKVGIGWDGQFLHPGGFAIAGNWKTGEGLWMTYEADKVPYLLTWTDYKFRKHPMRGAFTVEPWLVPALKEPGGTVTLAYEYLPFDPQTPAADFPTSAIGNPQAVAEAERFLRLVRPHLEMIGRHTMVPEPNTAKDAITQNRFFYSHRRRDRMALREWGIADALFSMPGKQDIPARIRFFAKSFPNQKSPVSLRFEFFVQNEFGKRVREEKRTMTLGPENPDVDQRVDVDLSSLPDGPYEVGVEVFEEGRAEPIHRVTESRHLVGEAYRKLAASRKVGLTERPFVTALRTVPFDNASLATLDVPIGLEDASGLPRENWPISAGVPFSKGMVPRGTALVLTDPNGREVGFDSRVAATWDDGSIRWVLIDFNANIPADGHVFYHLRAGHSKKSPRPALLTSAKGSIAFDNGPRQWRWNASEGTFGPLRADDLRLTDAEGRPYRFRLQGEGAGLIIEQNGAFRAVVRATGWYFADGVEKPIARGILRFEGFFGQPQLKIEHNVMFAGNAWTEGLESFGLTLPLGGHTAKKIEVDVDGATKQVSIPFVLDQSGEGACRIASDGAITLARRASGVFAFPDPENPRTVVFRNFWRMFPKQVRMDSPSAVTFFYWPKQKKPMTFLPREDGWIPSSSTPEAIGVGSSRTHEFYLIDGPLRPLQESDRLFDEPVVALTPPRYLAETRAMMHLQPYDPERWPEVEELISQSFDSYLLNQDLWGWYGQWTYGALPNLFLPEEYRWADFGRYAHILNEQDIVQTAWLAYLRSGDRKYLKFAEANTRQLMEVSTIHWNDIWPESIGLSRRHHETVWLSDGDYGHTMLDPYLEMYHVLGYQPAWEAAQAAAEAMKRQHTGEWRYISNPLAGLSRMYLETQDPSYKKEADRIWNALCFPDKNDWWLYSHGNRAVMYYSQINPDCKKLWHDWALNQPDRFTGMDVLSAQFLETQDPRYAEAAGRQFQIVDKRARTTSFEDDPLRWRITNLTQRVLDGIREMCYAGSTLEAAKKLAQKADPNTMPSDKNQPEKKREPKD